MNYNYVMFGNTADFFRISWSEITQLKNVIYRDEGIDCKNRFFKNLYRLHTSPKTNKIMPLPFKRIWNKYAFRGKFDNDKPICFLFYPRSRWLENGIIKYLRKQYENCKIGIVFQDLVKRSYPNDIEQLQKKVDFCLSFDNDDVKNYNMIYYPLVYSKTEVEDDDSISSSDVYFVGKAKDRLEKILAVYEKLRSEGLKCDFYLTGVDEQDQKYTDEITYGRQMPYKQNLKHIKKTKVLLEIMQGGGKGYTLRACEAVAYGKKLLSDNSEIEKVPFYNSDYISKFVDLDSIDIDFIKKDVGEIDYNYVEEFSPKKLIEFLDGTL